MIKLLLIPLILFALPSGIVLATLVARYGKRYLDLRFSMLEDKRHRELQAEYEEQQNKKLTP